MDSEQKLSKEQEDLPDETKSSNELPNDLEKQDDQKKADEPQYVTGIKLWSMMSGVVLVVFLMLLDISIVSTVSTSGT